jgi:hypothetical protein
MNLCFHRDENAMDVDEKDLDSESQSESQVEKPRRRTLAKMPSVNFSKKGKKRTLTETQEGEANGLVSEVPYFSLTSSKRISMRSCLLKLASFDLIYPDYIFAISLW